MLHLPRFMLAAPSSGSGKTMITCGLLQALVNRGLSPASFKCGPDYIDPMFHTKVIGTKSRNLDTFFTDRAVTRHLFARTAVHGGISVLEGVMGIYDGLGGVDSRASSYDLACVTDTPVILVVNARGMSLSAVPLIQGYVEYQKRLGQDVIRGVILNQTTKMSCQLLKKLIEEQTGVHVYGYVPRMADCVIESRHLGLVTPDEIRDLRQNLQRLSARLEECLDIDAILKLAEGAKDYEDHEKETPDSVLAVITSRDDVEKGVCDKKEKNQESAQKIHFPTKIAVAMDEAFCFYYQDNLDLLEEMGAKIVAFSPLRDKHLPDGVKGLILGGGYPELYAMELSQNVTLRQEIAAAIRGGMPYLAECGGFMYLHHEMEDMEGRSWPMCQVVDGKAFHTHKLGRFGYISLQARSEHQLLPPGETIRAHEFHYFDSTSPGEQYVAKKPTGARTWMCIHGTETSAAGYPHLYFWSNPGFALRFLKAANKMKKVTGGICGNDTNEIDPAGDH